MTTYRSALSLCCLLLASGANAADPGDDSAALGAQLAAVCAGCHAPGTAAESVTETFPNIWRLDAAALLQRLLDYQQNLGAPTLMNRIAKGYTADELELIATAIAASAPGAAP